MQVVVVAMSQVMRRVHTLALGLSHQVVVVATGVELVEPVARMVPPHLQPPRRAAQSTVLRHRPTHHPKAEVSLRGLCLEIALVE